MSVATPPSSKGPAANEAMEPVQQQASEPAVAVEEAVAEAAAEEVAPLKVRQ